MSDDFKTGVHVVATETGFDGLIKYIRSAQEELVELNRTGKITEDQLKKQSLTLNKVEKAFQGTGAAVAGAAGANQKVVDSQQKLNASTSALAGNLPRLRYALYDVSTTLAFAGVAMLGLATATVGTAIAMDRQFADVVRTTGTYLDSTGQSTANLRAEFNALFTSLPTSWSDLTDIGTLAGQLGVASENVAEFTELVTKFAATTDVSVEQSATAFGRLSTLLDVMPSQYENLGSSILKVGVNSVATESQIINTSSQIASMGNFAGLSADEVIGLSAALASLGVQPELSRGTITRVFTNITTAIANGSDKLDEFSRIARTDFAKAWETDPMEAFIMLLKGLQAEGDGAVLTLKDIGITASRDIPTILKLAQNYGLVAEQLDIARTGFEEGTTLQEQYGVIAETVASKLTIMKNNFIALTASIGESSSSLGGVIDFITDLIQAFDKLVSNPVGQFVAVLVIGMTVLGGILAVVSGALARGSASMLAMATAANDMAGANIRASVTTKQLTTDLMAMGFAGKTAAISIKGIKYALISTGIGAAIAAVGTAIAFFVQQADEGSESAQMFRDAFKDAIATDIQTFQDAGGVLQEIPQALDDATPSAEAFAGSLVGLNTDAETAATGVQGVTDKVYDLSAALGDAVDTAARKSLVEAILGEGEGGDQLNRAKQINASLAELGYTFEDIVNAVKNNDLNFLNNLNIEALDKFYEASERYQTSLSDADVIAMGSAETLSDFVGQAILAAEALQSETDAASATQFVMEQLGISTAETGGEFDGTTQSIRDFTDGIFDAINSEYALIGATYDLGTALATNGLDFSESTVAGRANLAALTDAFSAASKAAGGDANLYASYVKQIISQLVAAGVTGVQELAVVQQALAAATNADGSLATGTAITDMIAMRDLSGQIAMGMDSVAVNTAKTAKNARQARKEIRTLSDYVSDLSRVMSDAFDFRFGLQQSKDEVTSTIHDIGQSFADAREKVRDLALEMQEIQATITGLSATRTQLEYFLSIAVEYGDSLRATAIQAELAENAAETAKAQEELADKQRESTKAQQDATPTLTGNTEAAIAQRAAILQLVQGVEDQIAAYAATGASQAQVENYARKLKTQLEAQLKQWGYNSKEVKTYTAAIDDFVQIIREIPRDLTVKVDANTSPAEKALAEFRAKHKDQKINYAVGVSGPSQKDIDRIAKANRLMELNAQIAWRTAALKSPTGSPGYYKALTDQIAAINAKIKSGNYADGGFTGRGPKYAPAGTVHRGEYVIPKEHVNQNTGLPYADAFNRISRGVRVQAPTYAQGGFVQGLGGGPIDLSAGSIQQLARAVQPYLVLNGRVLENATSSAYAGSTRIGSN